MALSILRFANDRAGSIIRSMKDTGLLVMGGFFTVAAIILAYAYYHKEKFKRSPEGIALAEKLALEEKRKSEEDERGSEERNRKAKEWTEAHPRLDSFLKGLGYGALAAVALAAALLLASKGKSDDWVATWGTTLSYYVSAGSALASLFYLLGAIFTPDGASKLVAIVVCGVGVLWVVNEALESTKSTIILGFVIVIGIILYGIEEIKREIRKHE